LAPDLAPNAAVRAAAVAVRARVRAGRAELSFLGYETMTRAPTPASLFLSGVLSGAFCDTAG